MAEEKEKEDLNLDNAWQLFAPKSTRGLRVDYPELADYSEFKVLRLDALLFVWYYACKSSPLFNSKLKKRDLVVECMRKSKIVYLDPEKREKFISGDFGEKIESAIKVMYSFEPSIRILSKKLAVKQLADIEKMTSLKLDDHGNHVSFHDKEGGIDMNKKKAYMSMIMSANEKMDSMIQRAEKGFGVTKKDSKSNNKNFESSGESFAESYHENH